MEPRQQVEIQLGHMCNNRCVFCVSGQRTARGEAGPMAVEPILGEIRAARARGHAKITLLGGEPTLQPGFLDVVRECARLGFEEVVVFTNGAKTANPDRIDEILATGANVAWRISIQGATETTHERTTKKDGSFGRIQRTLEHLAARSQRVSVNMCVVGSNFEDVDRFAEWLPRANVWQLHLDLMRPLDAGERTEDELREMMPPLRELTAPMERLARAMPAGFDVNFGNVPYCVAPSLIPWIHHDGERTETIAVDSNDALSRPWNKYLVKARDKVKPESCRRCAMDDRCSGIYEHQGRFHGTRDLVPIRLAQSPETIPERRTFLAPALADALARLRRRGPFGALRTVEQSLASERAELVLECPDGARATVWLDLRARPHLGYRLDGAPTAAMKEGLASMIHVLRAPAEVRP